MERTMNLFGSCGCEVAIETCGHEQQKSFVSCNYEQSTVHHHLRSIKSDKNKVYVQIDSSKNEVL